MNKSAPLTGSRFLSNDPKAKCWQVAMLNKMIYRDNRKGCGLACGIRNKN